MQYNSRNHAKFSLKAHVIFCVKYRKQLLTGNLKHWMNDKLISFNNELWKIETIESDLDHIHMLIDYVPTITIQKIVKMLKQRSTFDLWKVADLSKEFWKERTFWSDGYFACSTGQASTETIRKYIEQQG